MPKHHFATYMNFPSYNHKYRKGFMELDFCNKDSKHNWGANKGPTYVIDTYKNVIIVLYVWVNRPDS